MLIVSGHRGGESDSLFGSPSLPSSGMLPHGVILGTGGVAWRCRGQDGSARGKVTSPCPQRTLSQLWL